jgi:hypothetical protein
MTKLIFAFRNFANVPKITLSISHGDRFYKSVISHSFIARLELTGCEQAHVLCLAQNKDPQ